jgi:hypothetical protein
MAKKRSKARVYIYRVFVLSIVSACLYGAYQGYQELKPSVVNTEGTCLTYYYKDGVPTDENPDQLTKPCKGSDKELDAIMNSAAFKAKAQNLAEQQLLTDKINAKKDSIANMQKDIASLQSELETKRNAGLSL